MSESVTIMLTNIQGLQCPECLFVPSIDQDTWKEGQNFLYGKFLCAESCINHGKKFKYPITFIECELDNG